MRTSDRISAVDSADELHVLLSKLASDPACRWTRTQILYFLPEKLHGIADEYFDGERLRIPERRPLQLETVQPAALDEALSGLSTLNVEAAEEEKADRFRPPAASALEADPPTGPDDSIGLAVQALLHEIRVVDREAPKRYRLSDGRCIGPQGEYFVYLFTWSSEPDPFVPGELKIGEDRVPARVGRHSEGKQFEIWVDDFLGPTIAQATFWIDPTFLLRTQFQRLKEFRNVFDRLTGIPALLFAGPQPLPDGVPKLRNLGGLNADQQRAVAVARAADLGYIWGPPGTGKTTSLGHLIGELVDCGQRVLVLSPYNVAVDEAIKSASRQRDWGREQIVRMGRISEDVRRLGLDLDSILELHAQRTGLLDAARQLHAAVFKAFSVDARPAPATVRRCLEELGEIVVRSGKGSDARRVAEATKQLRRLYRAPEASVIADASVVGTTISLSFVSSLIYQRPYDHVIVDEASVVRTPEALLVAMMSGARLSFFGDPKQLPSIVRCKSPETEKWLRPNPFELAKIRRPEDAKGSCAILTQQHRMAPPIRQVVSELFYDGVLQDGNCPSSGRLILIDTSSTPAVATTKWVRMSQSRENQVHRNIVASLLWERKEASNGSVLVLAPFRAQVDGYKKEIGHRIPRLRCETVHTSQGSESDIVVLDLVLAPGRGKSRFLDETRTPEMRNLLNVGISRAKRELIVLAHCAQIRRELPLGLLDQLLQRLTTDGEYVRLPADLRLVTFWRGLFGTGLTAATQ